MEPPIGIEPMTYALRVTRGLSACQLGNLNDPTHAVKVRREDDLYGVAHPVANLEPTGLQSTTATDIARHVT